MGYQRRRQTQTPLLRFVVQLVVDDLSYNKSAAQANFIDIWPWQWPDLYIITRWRILWTKTITLKLHVDVDVLWYPLQLCWICMLNYRILYKRKTQSVGESAYSCPTGSAFPFRRLYHRC